MDTSAPSSRSSAVARARWYRILYVQVLLAVALGVLIGALFPEFGKSLKPLGDAFVKLVKMIVAPIIFCTVVHGIGSMRDLKKLGRIGGKALLYFEVLSTIALILGLVVINVLKPGVGFNSDPATLDPSIGRGYAAQAHSQNVTGFILNIIPDSFFSAFATGDLLQVLLVAVLSAFAISAMGQRGRPIMHGIESAAQIFFGIMRFVVKIAPVAALGAMAFTVGSYGLGALNRLVLLMLSFYLTAGVFVIGVLGCVGLLAGFSIFRLLNYIKEEILLVLGTSSSETALPGLLAKMHRLGCAESTVGLVVPTGYSFNLDGTNIYMTMAAVFLAQATNTPLGLKQQIGLMLVAMISSKGASGVTGAGFITLAATLAAVPSVPIESVALLVGIDRFMSECRAITNLIGNAVATIVVSRWDNEITPDDLQRNLSEQISVVELTPEAA